MSLGLLIVIARDIPPVGCPDDLLSISALFNSTARLHKSLDTLAYNGEGSYSRGVYGRLLHLLHKNAA